MIRTYIDWLLELPWSETTRDRLDVAKHAQKILDERHYFGFEQGQRAASWNISPCANWHRKASAARSFASSAHPAPARLHSDAASPTR